MSYFFRPRTGRYYADGYKGQKVLVLGAYHYCWREGCPYRSECVVEGKSRDYDLTCPLYAEKQDKDYYRLANSNVIEMDSYLEGEHYPVYDAFTHSILHQRTHLGPQVREELWEHLAFYNFIQHYLPDAVEDFSYERWKDRLMEDLPAFAQVLEELRPDVLFVWTEALRRLLEEYPGALGAATLGQAVPWKMDSLEVWLFNVRWDNVSGRKDVAASVKVADGDVFKVLETVRRCRAFVDDGSDWSRSLYPVVCDDRYIRALTLRAQDETGLSAMSENFREVLAEETGAVRGRIFCNFLPSAEGYKVVPLKGLYPEDNGRLPLLTIWDRFSFAEAGQLEEKMTGEDLLMVYLDRDEPVPGTMLRSLCAAVR